MTLLESISGPRDLKALSPDELPALASEIRDFLIEAVSRNGGHLGPNLGVVELTIALHRVFDSPADRIVFDTGHQAYVHKVLTGRQDGFARLKQRGGVSGYPNQAESEHDIVENSHASTALSYADGLAKAYQVRGEHDRTVVAVVGDGALTGGMAWEALNNIADAKNSRLVIVVNDNGRSYTPTIGGLAAHLAAVRVSQRYEHVLEYIKTSLPRAPLLGPPLYETLHGIKKGLKDMLQPQVLFEDLGIKYLGPVDGHDEQLVEHALRSARGYGSPVIVHVITRKGFGYPPAEADDEDCLHSPAAFDPATGRPTSVSKRGWTDAFSEELVALGAVRPDLVAITAAMLYPTGLAAFARAYPDRCLRRRHRRAARGHQRGRLRARRAAPGGRDLRDLPQPGLRPGPARCRTAQAAGDVRARPGRGDRGGRAEPQRHVGRIDPAGRARPEDRRPAGRHPAGRAAEREAVDTHDGPTVLRFPKGAAGADVPAVATLGRMDVLYRPGGADGTGKTDDLAAPPATTCCCSGPARWPGYAWRPRASWPTRASA